MGYGLDVHLLAWFSHPAIMQPGGRLQKNTIGKFTIGAMCFSQMKAGSI